MWCLVYNRTEATDALPDTQQMASQTQRTSLAMITFHETSEQKLLPSTCNIK